jgi:hypothetical protein
VTEDAHAGTVLVRHAARLVEQADAMAMCLDFDGTLDDSRWRMAIVVPNASPST